MCTHVERTLNHNFKFASVSISHSFLRLRDLCQSVTQEIVRDRERPESSSTIFFCLLFRIYALFIAFILCTNSVGRELMVRTTAVAIRCIISRLQARSDMYKSLHFVFQVGKAGGVSSSFSNFRFRQRPNSRF